MNIFCSFTRGYSWHVLGCDVNRQGKNPSSVTCAVKASHKRFVLGSILTKSTLSKKNRETTKNSNDFIVFIFGYFISAQKPSWLSRNHPPGSHACASAGMSRNQTHSFTSTFSKKLGHPFVN